MAKGVLCFLAVSLFVASANANNVDAIIGLLKSFEPPSNSLLSFVPPQLLPYLPPAVKSALAKITTADLKEVKKMALNYQFYNSLEQILGDLPPVLKALAKQLIALAKEKFQEIKSLLIPEAKSLFQQLLQQGKDALKQVVETYDSLSDEAKENLKETFPMAAQVLEDPTFQKVANQIIYS
jgi:gas vesicle protein